MKALLAVLLLAFAAGQAAAQNPVVPLVCEGASLYADMQVQDSIPVRVLLDAGASNSLIDLALVREYPALFPLDTLGSPLQFEMADGVDYRVEYKLASGLKIAGTRSLGDVYAVDLDGQDHRILYPLNGFTTDTIACPGAFLLDIRHGELTALTPGEQPEGSSWTALEMRRDDESGLFFIRGALQIVNDAGIESSTALDFTLDLGGGSLLVLLAYKPFVGFFAKGSLVRPVWEGTSQGLDMRVIKPARITLFGQYSFSDRPVILLDRPVQVSGDGLLGLPFLESFRAVLDFRNKKLLLAPAGD